MRYSINDCDVINVLFSFKLLNHINEMIALLVIFVMQSL